MVASPAAERVGVRRAVGCKQGEVTVNIPIQRVSSEEPSMHSKVPPSDPAEKNFIYPQ